MKPRNAKSALLLSVLLLAACYPSVPLTSEGRFEEAVAKIASASSDDQRFYALNTAAKEAFVLEKYAEAEQYATELQSLTPQFRGNWNYGNAVQDFNLVFGRLAVREGKIEEAKEYLLAAGRSPGSPQMNSFGPNMSLAKDLLEQGERETVLEYFNLCRSFWSSDRGRLDQWTRDVESGKTPDFGPNLVY